MSDSSPPAKTSVGRRFTLSGKAVGCAWLLFNLILFGLAGVRAIFDRYAWANSQNPFFAPLLIAIGSAVVLFVVWIVLALPLALFVPDHSVFWKPKILTLIGASTGAILVWCNVIYQIRSNGTYQIYNLDAFYQGDVILPTIPAALIGAITGAFAAQLHKKLRGN